ncbi:hypothetical protein DVH05_004220 [Phytophthora capsici]|nr:hypothetical protein DVH05_004220 [Phytophthora capsici]
MSRNGTVVFTQMLESLKRFEDIATGGEAPYISQASVWTEHLSDTQVPPTAIDEESAHRKEDRPKQHEADPETSSLNFIKDLTSPRSHTGDVTLSSSHPDVVALNSTLHERCDPVSRSQTGQNRCDTSDTSSKEGSFRGERPTEFQFERGMLIL